MATAYRCGATVANETIQQLSRLFGDPCTDYFLMPQQQGYLQLVIGTAGEANA